MNDDLLENAPCGYLTTRLDGTFVQINRTFEGLTGFRREELVGNRRFQDLLAPGDKIYHETHYAPLLRMQGSVREIAVEIVCASGHRLPALVNSDLSPETDDQQGVIRTTVFDATDRRRYEQELLVARQRDRDMALELQRSLLSGVLPVASGLDLGVAYRAAVRGTEAGGDWYDAFWLDEHNIALVVGDVVGRGIHAAAAMGQLRSAIRALAATGRGPSSLLESLDEYARRHSVGQMATVVYADLCLTTGALRYACAGHPPPLVAATDGHPDYLWGGRSTPLDTRLGTGSREQASLDLSPGSTVVLYTDGVIESRSSSLTDGMTRLAADLAKLRDLNAADLAESVVHAIDHEGPADDICVLTARWSRA